MIQTIGVIGAGTMGSGIAQVFAQAGFSVLLHDVAQPALDRGRGVIDRSLAKFVEKAKITAADREAALGRLRLTMDLGAMAEADYVVEAAIERVDVKRALFQELDRVTRPEVMLTSNTSSISITTLAAATRRPERVLGMHFMNPVPLMALVEVIRGQATSAESMAVATGLCERLGKTAVEAADYPGFIANRILMPMINENEAGHEPPHGPVDAGGLHRPRRLPRHSRGPARRPRRPEVPAVPAAAAHGGGRTAGPQVRTRLLSVLRAPSRPPGRRNRRRQQKHGFPADGPEVAPQELVQPPVTARDFREPVQAGLVVGP